MKFVLFFAGLVVFSSGSVIAAELGDECRPTFALAMERANKKCQVWGCHNNIAVTAEVIAKGITKPNEIISEVRRHEGNRYYSEGLMLLMAELGLIKLEIR